MLAPEDHIGRSILDALILDSAVADLGTEHLDAAVDNLPSRYGLIPGAFAFPLVSTASTASDLVRVAAERFNWDVNQGLFRSPHFVAGSRQIGGLDQKTPAPPVFRL
jgi:hypothetical protein